MNAPPLFEQFYRKAGIALPESFCAATLLTFSLFGPGFSKRLKFKTNIFILRWNLDSTFR